MDLHGRMKTVVVIALACLFTIALSGCMKVRSAMNVNADGTGTIALALGINAQAKAMFASQGQGVDPLQAMEDPERNTGLGFTPDKVNRWVDGDYEYREVVKNFTTLDEARQLLTRANTDFFKSFSITREAGFWKERFIIDAEIVSFADNATAASSGSAFSNVDVSTFVDVQFAVKLPGQIVENNGVRDAVDPALSVWKMQSKVPTKVRLVSETWNVRNLGLLFGIVCFVLAALGGVALFFALTRPARRG